jgi:hypothetical protein
MLVDEFMSEWCPNLTKLESLPNYTFKPHKPAPLGTKCILGLLAVHEVVQNPEQQAQKAYHGCISQWSALASQKGRDSERRLSRC